MTRADACGRALPFSRATCAAEGVAARPPARGSAVSCAAMIAGFEAIAAAPAAAPFKNPRRFTEGFRAIDPPSLRHVITTEQRVKWRAQVPCVPVPGLAILSWNFHKILACSDG